MSSDGLLEETRHSWAVFGFEPETFVAQKLVKDVPSCSSGI